MTDPERFLKETKVSNRIVQEIIMHLDIREVALALSHASDFVREVQRTGWLVALDEARETIDHPVMRKAMQYFLDGWDHLLARSLLADFVTRHVEDERRECRRSTVDLPDVVKERMKALRAELWQGLSLGRGGTTAIDP